MKGEQLSITVELWFTMKFVLCIVVIIVLIELSMILDVPGRMRPSDM